MHWRGLIVVFLDSNNGLSKRQFGFRKHHSTTLVIIEIIELEVMRVSGLNKRDQCASLNDKVSEYAYVQTGVPQGSIWDIFCHRLCVFLQTTLTCSLVESVLMTLFYLWGYGYIRVA